MMKNREANTMMKLFDEIPYLENDSLIIRPLTVKDADAVCEIADNENVYRYLPTFLFEQKYEDKAYMIERLVPESFAVKDSIILGICLRENPQYVIGLAEIYNYDEQKEKASVGCRLNENYWYKGIAGKSTVMLMDYLFEKTDVRKITAHVMEDNKPSQRALEKLGFERRWEGLCEDWGRGEPVRVCKYMYKISKEEKERIRCKG